MTQRTLTSSVIVLVLLTSLLTGAIVSGAQEPAPLTQTFTWQPYELSVRYPAGWRLFEGETAVSLAPAERDVSDGFGPELVLFDQPGTTPAQFEAIVAAFAASSGALRGASEVLMVGGYPALRAALIWPNPEAMGEILLIAAKANTALGAAYIVRAADAPVYADTLAAMFASVALGALPGVRESISTASVQLPQAYTWTAAGLLLRFPADWAVEPSAESPTGLIASPVSGSARTAISAAVAARGGITIPLRQITDRAVRNYGAILDSADATIAGHAAVVYDLRDDAGAVPLTLRVVALDLPERGRIALIVLGTETANWEALRPTFSAIIGAIESVGGVSHSLAIPIARQAAGPVPLPRQDDPPLEPYLWQDYGVTIDKPADWEVISNGQDFDLGLVAPGVLEGGAGAYVLLRMFTSLGPGVTLKDAIAPVAEEAKASITDYAGGGVGFRADSADGSTVQHLVLYPYEDKGSALFVQASTPAADEPVVTAILASIAIAPPVLDYAAVDAAWQTSLAENGTLSYGSADAPVVMREYLSFTCGHCATFTMSIRMIMALDSATGRVRMEIAPLAGDEKSTLATKATYCAAEQGKGYTAYHALFQSYLDLGYDKAYTRDSVFEVLGAAAPELDMAALTACIDENRYVGALNQVRNDFVGFGLTGTPTMMVGLKDQPIAPLAFPSGETWSGAVPLGVLRTLVSYMVDDGLTPAEASQRFFNG